MHVTSEKIEYACDFHIFFSIAKASSLNVAEDYSKYSMGANPGATGLAVLK